MTTTIHNRFDPAKNVDSIAFRQDRVLQSAELNELQAGFAHRLRGLGDALFKNGDVLRGARIIVNPTTGDTVAEDGAICSRSSRKRSTRTGWSSLTSVAFAM